MRAGGCFKTDLSELILFKIFVNLLLYKVSQYRQKLPQFSQPVLIQFASRRGGNQRNIYLNQQNRVYPVISLFTEKVCNREKKNKEASARL